MIRKMIKVKFQFAHVHRWPECDIDNVAFLRFPHRHVFQGTMWREIKTDRQIEFIDFEREIMEYIDAKIGKESTLSCEAMASMILDAFHAVAVEITEDGEHGALVWRDNG